MNCAAGGGAAALCMRCMHHACSDAGGAPAPCRPPLKLCLNCVPELKLCPTPAPPCGPPLPQMCRDSVYYGLVGDIVKSYDTLLPPLLEANVSVLVYAGRTDLVCNYVGQRVRGAAAAWAAAAVLRGQSRFERGGAEVAGGGEPSRRGRRRAAELPDRASLIWVPACWACVLRRCGWAP